MGLGGCAIGISNIDLFAKMTGIDFHVEGPVGQFALGRGIAGMAGLKRWRAIVWLERLRTSERFSTRGRCWSDSCRAAAAARGPPPSPAGRATRPVPAAKCDVTDDLAEPRLFATGALEGTGGAVTCCGSGGIFAALPKPLGSLTELLSPVPAPGPIGMPLTPAVPAPNEPAGGFCADDGEEIARTASRPKTRGRR